MVSHERSIPYPPYSHDEESAHPGASDPGGRGHDSFACRGQALTSAFSRPAAPTAEACVRRCVRRGSATCTSYCVSRRHAMNRGLGCVALLSIMWVTNT